MARVGNRKAIATAVALGFVAVFLALVFTHAGRAKPRPAPQPPLAGEFAFAPAIYFTSINIHNPSLTDTLTLFKRAVQSLPEAATPLAPSGFQTYSLGPGGAVEVDCTDIVGLLTGTPAAPTVLIEGFVSVFAVGPLDVKGVYSSYSPATPVGLTLKTLTIEPRIEFPGAPPALANMPYRILEYSAKFLCGSSVTG
jgi:hypothetical protein